MHLYKKIIITIFSVILISILSVSDANAQVSQENSLCGMVYTATEGVQVFPYEVDPKSFTICDQDISYKMIYMLFGASMDANLSSQLFNLFHEPDNSTLLISEISPVGRVIKTIYESFTYLFFTVFIAIVGYQTIRYIHFSQSSGSFMGEKDGRKNAANVALTSLVVIILATPVGSLIMIQAIIISLSVPAIMLANYFLSGFLANVQTETTKVQISNELLSTNSDTFATEHLFGQLCEDQTQQAILNQNYTSGSSYSGGFFRRLFGRDDPMEFIQMCNTYTDTLDTNSEGFLISVTSEIRYRNCDLHRKIPRIFRFRGSSFGSNHQCSTTTFTQPDKMMVDKINTDTGKKLKDETFRDVLRKKNENGSYYSRFAFRNIKNNVLTSGLITDLKSLKEQHRSGAISDNEFNERKIEVLNRSAEEFKNNYLIRHNPIYKTIGEGENQKEILVGYDAFDNTGGMLSVSINDALSIGDNQETFAIIYMRHLSAMNKALGGYVSPVESFYEANRFLLGGGIGLKSKRYERDIKKLHEGVTYTGIEQIRADMGLRQASRDLMAKNCIETLDQHSDGLRFYNRWLDNNNRMISGSSTPTMSCIVFRSLDRENKVFQHLLGDKPFFPSIANIRSQDELFEFQLENGEMLNNISSDLENDVTDKLMSLSAYNYIIRKAFMDNLSIELKRNADFKVLADTRARGWAGLGSMMMSISSEQSSASGYTSELLNTGNPSSYSRVEDDPQLGRLLTAVNTDVFNFSKDEEFDEIVSQADINVFGLVSSSSLLGLTELSSSSKSVSGGSTDFSFLEKILIGLIEFVFGSPLNYLKVGSGMDISKNIPENLSDCSVSGNCYPSTTHPLNATIMFGQGLLSNSFTAILMLVVVKVVAELILGISTVGGDNKKNNSAISGAKKLIGGLGLVNPIMLAVKVIAYLLILVTPLLISLFTVMLLPGVLLGYILPIIPYLMTVMVVLGWFLLIFIKTIAFPISLLMASKVKEDGQSEINLMFFWQKLGDILIKPSLITIAIIFSWILVNVSIYYINTTMFSVFEITAFGGGNAITNMLGIVISYFIYTMVIYFVLQHSFSIILKFSDEVTGLLHLGNSDDQSNYANMGVEKMLAAQQISGSLAQAARSPEGALNSLRNKIAKKGGNSDMIEGRSNSEPHNGENSDNGDSNNEKNSEGASRENNEGNKSEEGQDKKEQ